MSALGSDFYRWMLDRARQAGHDPDAPAEGMEAPLGEVMLVWASLALNGAMTPEQDAGAAASLGVTPQELREAYEPEMRREAMAQLLDRPDLAVLDPNT